MCMQYTDIHVYFMNAKIEHLRSDTYVLNEDIFVGSEATTIHV